MLLSTCPPFSSYRLLNTALLSHPPTPAPVRRRPREDRPMEAVTRQAGADDEEGNAGLGIHPMVLSVQSKGTWFLCILVLYFLFQTGCWLYSRRKLCDEAEERCLQFRIHAFSG